MKILVTLILLFLTHNAYANLRGGEFLKVTRPDGSIINYYLFKGLNRPHSKDLLLILQGSSCNSVLRIEAIFNDYKRVRPNADLLLIEKYGIDKKLSYSSEAERKDCPAQYLKKDSPNQRVIDISIVLNVVREKRTYDQFIVMGGSEGATIANLLSGNIGYIDATISFNGGGRWFIDDVMHNIASGYTNKEEAQKNIEGFRDFSEKILNSEPFDLSVSGHGYQWWSQMLSIDQLKTLQKVSSPLLIVQGGVDFSVSPKKVDEMMSVLRELEKENIEYLTYEKLDHGFNNAEGQSELKKVITDMGVWLDAKLNNPNKSIQPTAKASAD